MKKIVNALFNITRKILNKPVYINLNIVSTNKCTQRCPMCNASIDYKGPEFTLEIFKKYIKMLKKYRFLSCTISGGEPTLVKELPEIIHEAKKYFPFGVSLITNLYGKNSLFYSNIDAALRENINITVSFDGFGEVADKLRKAPNVSETVMQNIEYVNRKKKELESKSGLTLHTVMSDKNIPQVEEIMDYAKKIGWSYTFSPVNNFFYQETDDPDVPRIHYSDDLKKLITRSLTEPHMKQSHKFLKGILYFVHGKSPKFCPYLKPVLKNYKVFLEPDGSVYLCDRMSLGTLDEKPLHKMFQGEIYESIIEKYKKCPGCWHECFVSPMLYPALNKDVKKYSFEIEN